MSFTGIRVNQGSGGWRIITVSLIVIYHSAGDLALADHKVASAAKLVHTAELSVAQLRQRDQGVVNIWVNHVLSADLVGHSRVLVDEHAEVKSVFDGLHVETLMLRLLVTACKELIQRCQLVEDAEGRLPPEEELLRLAFFDRVDNDRSEARRFDLHNVHALVKLGNRLES